MTIRPRPAFCLLPILALLVYGVSAVEQAATSEKPVPVSIDAKDTSLAAQITNDLRSDPLFTGIILNVDLYHGLAIVHGGAANQGMIDAINRSLGAKPGVQVIFNYMSYPGQPPQAAPQSIAATYDYLDRISQAGDTAFGNAGRVQERLRAAPGLADVEFQVDAYVDLIILHGVVSDPVLERRARDIAAHTSGVGAVLAYIGNSPTVAEFMTAPIDVAAPVFTRPMLEPVPAVYETRTWSCEPCDR